MCKKSNESNDERSEHVPDFASVGFATDAARPTLSHPAHVQALQLSTCVSASYDPQTSKICFGLPIYGRICVHVGSVVPTGAELRACAKTCGGTIPSGVNVTLYANGTRIWSGTAAGNCSSTQTARSTPMFALPSPCSICTSIAKSAIDALPGDISCPVASGLIAAAITTAADGNPVGTALGVVAVVVLDKYCQEKGWPWVKANSQTVAQAMCQAAHVC